MTADERIRQSLTILSETMRSCESCRYRQADYIIGDTFVCTLCAEPLL